MQTQSLDRGKIGEYICALRMLKDGIRCQIVNFEATDIIAYHYDRLLRIQVKSSTIKDNGKSRNKGYQFNLAVGGKQKRHLTDADCDIIALVAIEHEQVMFFPRERLHGAKKPVSQDMGQVLNLPRPNYLLTPDLPYLAPLTLHRFPLSL